VAFSLSAGRADLKADHGWSRVLATEAVGAAATVGAAAGGDVVEAGAGEVLASVLALEGRTGEPIGDRLGDWAGAHGGTTRIGTARQPMVRMPMAAGQDIWTIGTTIRHPIGLMRIMMDRKTGRVERTRRAVNLRRAT
jgi:hypothetical protein